jgi:tRNA threonylcarbamoyladenosine biosynthesis protein TsaB
MTEVNSLNNFPGPCLLLDAGGLATRVGLWEAAHWRAYHENSAPALEDLFAGARAVLTEAQLTLPQISGFLYVEGPGSVLGLRLAAMAIRAWQADAAARAPASAPQPVWRCGSFTLAAALALAGGARTPFAICSEARQGFWHILEITNNNPANLSIATIRTIPGDQLPSGPLFHLPTRKIWQTPPAHARPLPATLREHPEVFATPGLFRQVPTATPFDLHPPAYKKWDGATAKS